MEWKLTPSPIECSAQKTSIIKERAEAVGFFSGWAEKWRRRTDRRTSGWRRREAWPVEISRLLVNASVKDKEGGLCCKYENELMWKRWDGGFFLFFFERNKPQRKEGREEGRALWWWVLFTLFCMAGWHRSMIFLVLFGGASFGPKPLWIDCSDRASHTGLYSNVSAGSTGVLALSPNTHFMTQDPALK